MNIEITDEMVETFLYANEAGAGWFADLPSDYREKIRERIRLGMSLIAPQIIAVEREACARIADDHVVSGSMVLRIPHSNETAGSIAAAIRSRT